MNRRKILQQAAALPLMSDFGKFAAAASAAGTSSGTPFKRCRPGDADRAERSEGSQSLAGRDRVARPVWR